jgi:hypothetical protein
MQSPESLNNSPADDQAEARKPSLKWYPYFLINGNLKDKERKQPFEFSDCPTREDVETAIIESKFHPSGKYKVEKRKNGQPVEFFYCEKPDASFFQQINSKVVIESEPELDDDESDDQDAPEFDLDAEIQTRAELIALRRELAEIKRLEGERSETAQASQSEALSMMREMQKQSDKAFQNGREQGLEMMKMFTQLQPQQSQQNPTELMLSMLKGTLDVQRGVRELSDEISPNSDGTSSYIADAAKLVDSLGANVGKLLPLFLGRRLAQGTARKSDNGRQTLTTHAKTNGNGQGEFTDLLDKIKSKNEGEK